MPVSFEQVRERIDANPTPSSPSDNQIDSAPDTRAPNGTSPQDPQSKEGVAQAIAELEKMEKFRFDGQELTPKELKAMIMRQKDYTQKTQSLSEERKSFESYQRYYDNLWYDLEKVRANPELAQEFVKVYPEKFHSHLSDVLGASTSNGHDPRSSANQTPQIPVELLSKIQRLESVVTSQEVAKAEAQIQKDLDDALKDFKYASRKEVLADISEFHEQLPEDPTTGRKPAITPEMWRRAAEQSHQARRAEFETYYRELQEQQKQANSKGRDVGSGGGVPGGAPTKFKNFSDLSKHVVSQFTAKP